MKTDHDHQVVDATPPTIMDRALGVAIWRTFPLAQAAQAHRDLEAGTNHGKILLTANHDGQA